MLNMLSNIPNPNENKTKLFKTTTDDSKTGENRVTCMVFIYSYFVYLVSD